jgi:hypothetical protein
MALPTQGGAELVQNGAESVFARAKVRCIPTIAIEYLTGRSGRTPALGRKLLGKQGIARRRDAEEESLPVHAHQEARRRLQARADRHGPGRHARATVARRDDRFARLSDSRGSSRLPWLAARLRGWFLASAGMGR